MRRQGKRLFASYKKRGEWVELLFMTVAAGIGFNVAKPWGETNSYDVVIEHEGRFLRMQVKSTEMWMNGSYLCQLHSAGKNLYTAKTIDYYAIYVLPDDVWYIFPARTLEGMTAVAVTPHKATSKYNKYKEAWWLLTRHHFRRGTRTLAPGQDQRPSSINKLTGRIMKRVKGGMDKAE
jgi:hypothetical protein